MRRGARLEKKGSWCKEEEWELDLVGGCVAVIGGGVVGVGPARSAASPVYLEDVLKGRLVELVVDLCAVDATAGNPLCWDLYLARDVVE